MESIFDALIGPVPDAREATRIVGG